MEGVKKAANKVELKVVDVRNFNAKYRTKGEVYRFLATEAMIYLPPYQTVTIWFMKELSSAQKKVGFIIFYYSFCRQFTVTM